MHIIDFKPFFCDIKDLNEGTVLKDIYKRQFISPFNFHFNQTEMIEVLTKQIRAAKRSIQKPGGSQKAAPNESQKAALLSDANFKYFTKTELNLDLAEIKISFNDLIILKSLSYKFSQMNEVYEKYI